jgi:hypothetical protein
VRPPRIELGLKSSGDSLREEVTFDPFSSELDKEAQECLLVLLGLGSISLFKRENLRVQAL